MANNNAKPKPPPAKAAVTSAKPKPPPATTTPPTVPVTPPPSDEKGKEKEEREKGVEDDDDVIRYDRGGLQRPKIGETDLSVEGVSHGVLELLEALLDRVKQNHEHLGLQEQIALDYSATEELARLLGLSEYSNTLVVIGMQTSGKTTLLESLMFLPLGYAGTGCATRCCVLYRIRRTEGLSEPMCALSWRGERKEGLTITELTNQVSKIMSELKAIDTENVLEVTIEDPKVMTLTLVDLPGFVARKEDRDETGLIIKAEDIQKLALDVLKKSGMKRILWVKPLLLDKGNDNANEIHTQIDPTFSRTVVAGTFGDLLFERCKTAEELGGQLQQAWETGREDSQPWVLALPSISSTRKREEHWHELRKEIRDQLLAKEGQLLRYFDAVKMPRESPFRRKLGYTAFASSLQKQINKDFLENSEQLFHKLLLRREALVRRAESERKNVNYNLVKKAPQEIARQTIFVLQETIKAMFDGEFLEDDFFQQFARTLEEEEKAAASYLAQHGIDVPPEANVVAVDEGIAHSDAMPLNRVRTVRVCALIVDKLKAIQMRPVTNNEYLTSVPTHPDVDLMDPKASLGKTLAYFKKTRLLPFIPYAVWRAAFVLHDSFIPAVQLMKQNGWGYVLDNPKFFAALEEGYHAWVASLAESCCQMMTLFAKAFWNYETYSLPDLLNELREEVYEASTPSTTPPEHDALDHVVENVGVVTSLLRGNFLAAGEQILNRLQPRKTQEVGKTIDRLSDLERHFVAHKIILSTFLTQIVSGYIFRATDPRLEAQVDPDQDSRGPTLEEFLMARLFAERKAESDPFHFCRAALQLEERVQEMKREAELIKNLHDILRERLEDYARHGGGSLSGL